MRKWLIKKLSKVLSENILIELLIENLRKSTANTDLQGFEIILSEKEIIKFFWSLEITRNDKHLLKQGVLE